MPEHDLEEIADKARTYVFIREEGFYPIHIPEGDSMVPEHAHLNPGTLEVQFAVTGRVVWKQGQNDA